MGKEAVSIYFFMEVENALKMNELQFNGNTRCCVWRRDGRICTLEMAPQAPSEPETWNAGNVRDEKWRTVKPIQCEWNHRFLWKVNVDGTVIIHQKVTDIKKNDFRRRKMITVFILIGMKYGRRRARWQFQWHGLIKCGGKLPIVRHEWKSYANLLHLPESSVWSSAYMDTPQHSMDMRLFSMHATSCVKEEQDNFKEELCKI